MILNNCFAQYITKCPGAKTHKINLPIFANNHEIYVAIVCLAWYNFVCGILRQFLHIRDVGDRWTEWAIAHPGFCRSVKAISTRGG